MRRSARCRDGRGGEGRGERGVEGGRAWMNAHVY